MTRVAIVHDWLDRTMGGAERVTLEIARMFPGAPVYTLLFDGSKHHGDLDPGRVVTSRLQRLPAWMRRRPRYLLPLIPGAVEAWDFSKFDVVISSSAAFVKNIRTPVETRHVCYCHSPMRFAWDYWPRYLDEMRVGPLRRMAIRAVVGRMRRWDLRGVAGVDSFVANSATTRRRIRTYYRADSTIVYPPVETTGLAPAAQRADEYVTLATLSEYKCIGLAVQAFSAAGRRLAIIGDGPERKRLEAMAGPSIRFTGHVSDTERARLLGSAAGLIFPNEEDFGIAAVEALASGTPVIGFARGGLTETIVPGETGVLFEVQTVAALNQAVDAAESQRWNANVMRRAAARYAPDRFRSELRSALAAAIDTPGRSVSG
ncbi:MAG: glycosyltransferase [Candidatus Dormibacteria bacterium]